MDNIFNIPSMSMFNNNWELLLKFMENEGNPPFSMGGNLDLSNRYIGTLGNLRSVDGNLNLSGAEIYSLGNLDYVGRNLDLSNSCIQSLGNLRYVSGLLELDDTPVKDLGKLNYVGLRLFVRRTPNLHMSEEEILKKVRCHLGVMGK